MHHLSAMTGQPSAAGRDLLCPRVVGLAARRALDAVDEVKLARHLVPGDVPPAVRVEFLERRFVSRPGLHDRRNALAPSLLGTTDADDAEHSPMRLQRR